MLVYKENDLLAKVSELERRYNYISYSRTFLHVCLTLVSHGMTVLLESLFYVSTILSFRAMLFVDDSYWDLHYTLQEMHDGILISTDEEDTRIGSYEGYDITEGSVVIIARSDSGWLPISN